MVWWLYPVLSAIGGLLLLAVICLLIIRRFAKLEPYGAFIRLSNRRKLTFFRLFLLDQRVPLLVKLLPLFAAAYLASPIDLLPGIPFDDIAFALLALALMVKLTPKGVLEDLLGKAAGAEVVRPP